MLSGAGKHRKVVALVAVVGVAGVLLTLRFYWLPRYVGSHMNFGDAGLGVFVGEVEHAVGVSEALRAGGVPHREIDYSSIGFPRQESELQVAGTYVHYYEASFHRAPRELNQLEELFKLWPDLGRRARREYSKMTKDCQIVTLSANSYMLNCDGWKPTSEAELEQTVKTFKPRVEKFYLVSNHLVLYVPPFAK